ncbi:MAG: hypothetical protein Ta2E_06210 [Mycoplasmoidaceae bacterium]|nr:MAG: hypothetical protein Ta2E_06210 [Mycoplasmoidaceae bacterium]
MKKENKNWLIISSCVTLSVLVLLYILTISLARGSVNVLFDNKNIAFTLMGNKVAWYGLTMFLGFSMSIFLACMKMYKYKISIEPFYFFCVIGVPTAIVGARMGSCIIGQTEWKNFFVDFGSGLAIEWGVFFTIVVGVIFFLVILRNPKYFKEVSCEGGIKTNKKVSCWLYADCIAPSVLIGQIIGRFGNYFNQELTGPTTTDPNMINWLKTFFPWMEIGGEWKEPVFFYEQMGNILGLVVIYFCLEFVQNKKFRKVGDLAILYVLWYGIVRIIMTPLRMRSGGHSSGETANLITTICWIVIGFIGIILNHFVFAKYTRQYHISYICWISTVYFFTRIFKGWNDKTLKEQYNLNLKKFKRTKNEMLWYNNL